MIEKEDGHRELMEILASAADAMVGAPTLFETAIVLIARQREAGRTRLLRFLDENQVSLVPFDALHWELATEAFLRFGKGRHPARLNFGDCMTYATARLAARPLLCIGDDFARTDLQLALE